MSKAFVIIGIAALLVFNLACSRGGDGANEETTAETENATERREATPEVRDEEIEELVGPTSDESRRCMYNSDVSPADIVESDLPDEVNDEIFGEYKRISVYYSKTNDYGDPLDLIIEFGEPYFSPYIGGVTVDSIELYCGSSSGAKELRYSGPVGPGVESTWHETHLMTYSVDVGEPYMGTATILNLDMTYDLEDHGTGKIKVSLWMEP